MHWFQRLGLSDDELVTSTELCELAVITYRQLDVWCRERYLLPYIEAEGSGTIRYWSRSEIRIAAALGDLSRIGGPSKARRYLVEELRGDDNILNDGGYAILTPRGEIRTHSRSKAIDDDVDIALVPYGPIDIPAPCWIVRVMSMKETTQQSREVMSA